ncbi:hypothetical protein CENSYa_1707 [Cenarchaeum symbiosum A]|uniref:Uncharacterized protein n=1 Tax=Cenarchaeum symbiosum (strain A) TaxID=414004 RepID=A0RYA4_CENSY|nr:hypothetical protein CENSYa_1707 [Cenarchaeum symbiosum A]
MNIIESIWNNFLNDPVGVVSSLATVLVLALAGYIYFKRGADAEAKYQAKRDAEEASASKNLYLELKGNFEVITAKKFPDYCREMIIHNDDGTTRNIRFAFVELNHDFYDSLSVIGIIHCLKPQLQQSIQNAYRKIKRRNKYLDDVVKLLLFTLDDDLKIEKKKQAEQYLGWISDIERQLERDIPVITKELKKQFENV